MRFGHIFGLTFSAAPSAQMTSGVFLKRIMRSNEPKKTFHKFAFYFSCFVALLKSSWRLVEPAGVRTPERSTCHAYRAVARAVEMESDAQSSPADPDLIAFIASWAMLPAAIKVGIMAMVGG